MDNTTGFYFNGVLVSFFLAVIKADEICKQDRLA